MVRLFNAPCFFGLFYCPGALASEINLKLMIPGLVFTAIEAGCFFGISPLVAPVGARFGAAAGAQWEGIVPYAWSMLLCAFSLNLAAAGLLLWPRPHLRPLAVNSSLLFSPMSWAALTLAVHFESVIGVFGGFFYSRWSAHIFASLHSKRRRSGVSKTRPLHLRSCTFSEWGLVHLL